ncbi:MAG: hypothetical protein R3220_06485 [Balneolaceae bacterium]|nr:hypothetical protein [Balneolaceae bacterium]
MRRINSISSLFIFFYWVLLLTGCNDSFDPIQESDNYNFSIFGYLDVSADTQWVRVSPPRNQLDGPTEVPEMLVTLEHMESGETVVMKDSLFDVGNGFNYINFYTDMDIEPNQTYRVKAERPDGKSSQVLLSTPDDFPTPRFIWDKSSFVEKHYHKIIVSGADKIIDIQTWWFVRYNSDNGWIYKKFTFTYADQIYSVNGYGGAYVADVVYEDELETVMNASSVPLSPEADVEILHRQVYVANGGPDWNPEIRTLDDLYYAQLTHSNVENGLGYMLGISSKVIPYKTCQDDSSLLIACEEEEPYW